MGLRFDLRAANWAAYLISPGAVLPPFGERSAEAEVLQTFLQKMETNFYSSLEHRQEVKYRANVALRALRELAENWAQPANIARMRDALTALRGYFFDMPWTALIVPSITRSATDQLLCSGDFLHELVSIRPYDPGLILQLEDPPGERFSLTDVFPAFKTALTESNRWPGFLFWTPRGDSSFFPLPTEPKLIYERANWLAMRLAASFGVDLAMLRAEYGQQFREARNIETEVTIVHLSDIHAGSKEASQRIPRVAQLVRNLVAELGDRRLIFVISGDLMDDPQRGNIDVVRSFIDFLANLGGEALVTCLGNHDVRKHGYLAEDLRMVLQVPNTNTPVTWLTNRRVGLVTFNSVLGGHLARGRIGERQMMDVGSAIDRKKGSKHHRLIGILHHHPVPVPLPDWYSRPFYERIFGHAFEKTLELKDSSEFVSFAEQRRFRVLIHGHKHIPHVSATPGGVPVFGCGSSVGKIQTVDASMYMSVNVVTLDTATGRVTARLLAERIPGGGLVEEKRHELISSSDDV